MPGTDMAAKVATGADWRKAGWNSRKKKLLMMSGKRFSKLNSKSSICFCFDCFHALKLTFGFVFYNFVDFVFPTFRSNVLAYHRNRVRYMNIEQELFEYLKLNKRPVFVKKINHQFDKLDVLEELSRKTPLLKKVLTKGNRRLISE